MAAASTPAGGPLHQLPTDLSSRAAQIHHSFTSALRPWREFLDINVISPPISLSEATFRLRKNLHYFRLNYTFLSLLVLFFSLLFHPISLIVFLLTFAAWLHFYFYRDDPVMILDHEIHDLAVLIFLSLLTIVALIWTGVWLNVLVSVLIAGGLICFHGAMRFTDDFDEASPYGSLLDSPRGAYSQEQTPLVNVESDAPSIDGGGYSNPTSQFTQEPPPFKPFKVSVIVEENARDEETELPFQRNVRRRVSANDQNWKRMFKLTVEIAPSGASATSS